MCANLYTHPKRVLLQHQPTLWQNQNPLAVDSPATPEPKKNLAVRKKITKKLGFLALIVRFDTQRFNVHKDVAGDVTIAALHDVYVGMDGEGFWRKWRFWMNIHSDLTYCEDVSNSVHKLFNLRVKFLVRYILEALGTKPLAEDIKPALEAAFQKMDEQVKGLAEELDFHGPAVFLATKFNSVVVIVHERWVYTAGDSDAHIILARKLEPFYFTTGYHHASLFLTLLCVKERLQTADQYLVIGSKQIWTYIRETDYMLPILQSRIDVEGLNEACKSIVGPFKDRSKILIVITLQKHAHEREWQEARSSSTTSVSMGVDPADPVGLLARL
ncbi:hypothetical protein SELMODRAFT_428882 [Selaginella moellendorffii]|uniref:PPM-type phosphatase domain-containing protein n=1 Tax=Selaginella moellendorffii TaxID=88036 RepID=D8T4B0_SELML|nr:hypothetical protein SELMODRAFT_428882 [Selaginella moellendorffii]